MCGFLATYVLVSAEQQPSRGPTTHSWPSDLFSSLWWVESGAACITEHLDGPIADVHWHCSLSCGNNFTGSGSPVSLGRGPYFSFKECEASSELCYQICQNFFFPHSLLCPPSLTPLNLPLLLLKVPHVSFLASLVVMSPLTFLYLLALPSLHFSTTSSIFSVPPLHFSGAYCFSSCVPTYIPSPEVP